MEYQIKKGMEIESLIVPNDNIAGELIPPEVKIDQSELELIEASLDSPIGTLRLEEIVQPGEKIAIITSDETRPLPTYKVLPSVLNRLALAGIPDEDITVYIARGSHRLTTEEERERLIGKESYARVRCVDSDDEDLHHYGVTKRGTPIDIDRHVAEADRRICLGNIEYHYFAGYSGGVKAIMPGVSTKEAIQVNHRLLVDPNACIGKLDGNPLREDLEEAGAKVGVDFIVNVVLDAHKNVVASFCGDVVKAHRQGCKRLDELYRFELEEPADIVVVSNGGAPKDINLYQSQKALENARHAVREGGIIVLVASCREGLGNSVFEEWMHEADSPRAIIERLDRGFRLGGHKAAMVAQVLEHCSVYLVSDMTDEQVRDVFMTPCRNTQEAFDAAFTEMGSKARVLIMPYGGSTVPIIKA